MSQPIFLSKMAVGKGFEPLEPDKGFAQLAIEYFRPLSHLSYF